ncbi:MAG: CDP-alcohol phosphatidyltransferase family protein [Planctomycetes bacterium]|nr:CDP-alcohol phosphatidyltransferase family protein [Planctomycetota bacterium]
MKIPRVLILPSLCTLANALCGFGAITLTTHALLGAEPPLTIRFIDVRWAGYLIILAMVFDALDGRLARFARATSDFGGQLDSVSDAVSFGAAPAFLMNRVVVESLRDVMPAGMEDILRIAWICAAVYLGCALIRLARFNVENVHEEEAHMTFKGLPSPAAAGALVSLIIILAEFLETGSYPHMARTLLWMLPIVAAILGLLMVSGVRYTHLLNQLVRRRRPISHLVIVLMGILLVVSLREKVLPVVFVGYVFSGPVSGVFRLLAGRRAPPKTPGEPPPVPEDEDQDDSDDGSPETPPIAS